MLLSVSTQLNTSKIKQLGLPSLTISLAVFASLLNTQAVQAENLNSQSIKCNSATGFSPCFYVAGGVIGSHISPEGSIGGWSTSSTSSSGYKLLIGTQIKPHWFGELAYSDLGKATIKNNLPTITDSQTISYSIPSLQIGYLFKPNSATINYFVKGGLSFIQNSASSEIVPYEKQNSVLPSFSAGAQWQSPKNGLFARLSGDYHSSDATGVSLTVGYKFNIPKKNTAGISSTKYTTPQKRIPAVAKHTKTPVKRTSPHITNNTPPQLMRIISSIVKQPDFAGVLNGVDFKPRTAILTPRAEGVLNHIARKLANRPTMRVAIIGHTDSLGITEENILLSRSRASAVKAYLIKQGINANRIETEGLGDSQPRATNSTEAGRRANRRIELRAL